MSDLGKLCITLRVGESAGIYAPDGTLIAVVTPNNTMTQAARLVFKAPKDIRILRSEAPTWTKP
jgi:sRNA-binding carbon storage regulator CsrA